MLQGSSPIYARRECVRKQGGKLILDVSLIQRFCSGRYTKRFMRKHRFLQRTVLQEMKNRLQVQKSLPPLGIIAHGYEYYTRTSPFGIVYLRKEVGSNNEVCISCTILSKQDTLTCYIASAIECWLLKIFKHDNSQGTTIPKSQHIRVQYRARGNGIRRSPPKGFDKRSGGKLEYRC